ncbi:MAG: hypothetical protein MUC93_13565 [Bacteroidales bacterium]|jgi:hypothetical protein|nr:hypothetical protein [Bacteroidales bacterium]
MKNKIILGALFTLISGSAFAQDISLPDLEGFKKSTQYPVYQPENLWDFINGAADTYLALGFVDLHVAEYKKGRETIKLEIYRHSDHTMAFGIYASERSSSYRFVNLGSQGYIADGAINFFTGNYYVKIRTYSSKPKTLKAEESLATRVAGMLQGETEMPALLLQFPDEGKKINEETYINESVLGHQFLGKAFKAVYLAGTDEFSVFLMRMNSADETFRTVETYLAYSGIETLKSDEGKVVFSDGYNGTIFLSWKDDRIVIISGLAKDQADLADKYTSDILK